MDWNARVDIGLMILVIYPGISGKGEDKNGMPIMRNKYA